MWRALSLTYIRPLESNSMKFEPSIWYCAGRSLLVTTTWQTLVDGFQRTTRAFLTSPM